jgi:hypothetical protein
MAPIAQSRVDGLSLSQWRHIMDTPVRSIPGYDYGHVPSSPVSMDELAKLEAAASFSEEDRKALHDAAPILARESEAMVNDWRAKIGQQPDLAAAFFAPDGKPDESYKARVKARFVRWVADLVERPFDQKWLDYQHEIGLRHTPAKKNTTDRAEAPSVVPFRYLLAFAAEIIVSARERLAASGLKREEVDRLHAAWTKAVILTMTLWSKPYIEEELW